jgi:parallel beta-helix repeat protein
MKEVAMKRLESTTSTKCALFVCALLVLSQVSNGGSLEPSAPPAGTMKPLDQVEPRIPITSVPYTISASGSYYLTKDMNMTSVGTAIDISASNVTIDLCGYSLIGPNNGIGIYCGISNQNVEIRNGTIRNFNIGIATPAGCDNWRIINIKASNNGNIGIVVDGSNALFDHCTANNNGGSGANKIGINATGSALITNCTANYNGAIGIKTGAGSTVINCTAKSNGTDGINTQDNSRISGCVANSNAAVGINAGSNCMLSDCIANSNANNGITIVDNSKVSGCTANNNTAKGINAGNNSTVTNSICNANSTYGISAGLYCTISNCTANGNTQRGIYAYDYSTVTNCTASQNATEGIYAMSYCTVTCNNAGNNQRTGIFCWSGKVIGNTASNNNQINDSTLAGIMIWGASQVKDNTLLNNKVTNIFVHDVGSTVEGNLVRGSTNGIKFDSGSNYYKDNRASGNTTPWVPSGSTDGGGNVSF